MPNSDQASNAGSIPTRAAFPTLATYSICLPDITPAATATDVVELSGSASKTIQISYIEITADASAVGVIDFYAYKRSASNTGGTPVAKMPVPHDSANDPAASASLVQYETNPSALGAGQLIRAAHYALPSATSTGYPGAPWIQSFGANSGQPIVLNGINESLCISLNGQAIPSGFSMYVTIEWCES